MSEVFKKYLALNRRYVYLIVLILCSIPVLKPLGVPIIISEETKEFHREIEVLNPGDNVFISVDLDAAGYPEIGYPLITVIKELFKRDVKVIIAAWASPTPLLILPDLEMVTKAAGVEYGVDWMFYGFVPGGEPAIASIAANLHSFPTDFWGKPVDELPILKDLKTIEDVQLVIHGSIGMDAHGFVVRQINLAYGVRCIDICSRMVYPTIAPYVDAGQFSAVIKGARAAAEYEQIVGMPGKSSQSTDSQVLVQGGYLVLGIVYAIADGIVRATAEKEEEQ